jgi:carbamoylphosphate synthase large subunit
MTPDREIRLLILSVGSLLGQNILDALDPRRRHVRVIGANSESDNPRPFRCDVAYLVPAISNESGLQDRILDIVSRENPDLILPGRDDDVVFLSKLREKHLPLAGRIPCGSQEAARILRDKALSFRFARRNDLPFADTFVPDPAVSSEEAGEWLRRHRFPLLAKPLQGFGSRGIKLVLTRDHFNRILQAGGYVVQEWLGAPPPLNDHLRELDLGYPLFLCLPEEAQYAGQTVIAPDGRVLDVFCSVNTMVLGRCERSQAVGDPGLIDVTKAYAEAMARAGWRGSFNVQLKRQPDGAYKAHEMNGRMTGSTSARRWLGYDEIRMLVREFVGIDLGPAKDESGPFASCVARSLTDYPVFAKHVETLRRNGVWRASS